MLPEVIFGRGRRRVCGGELAHAGTAADVARNDRDGCLIDQQTALHGSELAPMGLVEDLGHSAVEVLELHRVGHAAKALQPLAHGAHIGEIHRNVDGFTRRETLVAAELQQKPVALHPALPRIAHPNSHGLAFDRVGGEVLPLTWG